MLHFYLFLSEMFQVLRKAKRVKHSFKKSGQEEKKKTGGIVPQENTAKAVVEAENDLN